MNFPWKLPVGVQSFKVLKEDHYLCVDKIDYLFRLIQSGRVYFLSCSHWFRKSLFLLFFMMLTGAALCGSCAKRASVKNEWDRTDFERQAGTAKNTLFLEEKTTVSADSIGTQDSLDGLQDTAAASFERQLIKEGSINFEIPNITETRLHIESLVQKYGAYISQEDERTIGSGIFQNITVRIPKAYFDVFVAELSGGVKKIDEKSVTVQDVTEEFIDSTARLAVKKETEQGYLRLLNQAKTIKDILGIQNELQDLRADIESLEGRLRYLKNAVNFSTLHISMYQQVEDVSETGLLFAPVWDAIKGGVRAFVAVCIALLYGWVFIALGIAVAIVIVRLRKRRRDKRDKK